MGMGAAGSGNHSLGSVTGGWGRSGGSEGSGESSGGRSSSDKEGSQSKGENRRKVTPTVLSTLSRADLDPRVLSNSGWGQTPIRQNTAWDVTSTSDNRRQCLRGDERKQGSTGSGWGTATPAAASQTPGGGDPFINDSGIDTIMCKSEITIKYVSFSFYFQVGQVGQNLQGQVLDGAIAQPLGTAKLQEMVKGTVVGMKALAIRVATTPVIPGAITNPTGTVCFSEVLDSTCVCKM